MALNQLQAHAQFGGILLVRSTDYLGRIRAELFSNLDSNPPEYRTRHRHHHSPRSPTRETDVRPGMLPNLVADTPL